MDPLVSVIICNYNQSDYLEKAVESALEQTYANTEVVVIDNGSTDHSRDLLRKYSSNPRVKLMLHEENAKVTQRLNEGWRASSGEFISILYADDYYLPEKNEKQVAAFRDLGPEWGVVYSPGFRRNVFTGQEWPSPSLRCSGYILKEMFLDRHVGYINPISPLLRRECYERYPYREVVFNEGEALFLRLGMTYKFFYLDEPLVVMQDHLMNMGKVIKKNTENQRVLLDLLMQEPEFPKDAVQPLRIFRSRALRNRGWQAVRVADDPEWARQCFREAVGWYPLQALHPRVITGLCLAAMPRPLYRALNGAGSRVRKHKGNVAVKADF